MILRCAAVISGQTAVSTVLPLERRAVPGSTVGEPRPHQRWLRYLPTSTSVASCNHYRALHFNNGALNVSDHLLHGGFRLFLASQEQLFLLGILISTSLQLQGRLFLTTWVVINVNTFDSLILCYTFLHSLLFKNNLLTVRVTAVKITVINSTNSALHSFYDIHMPNKGERIQTSGSLARSVDYFPNKLI